MVDILMAVYNGEAYLRPQIESIIGQSYTKWRLIIGDDGSDDGTVSIVREYIQKYPDKIVLLENSEEPQGAKYNFFRLIQYSTADYIMLADQDDVWKSDKVANSYEYIVKAERHIGVGRPVLCHGDLCVVDEKLSVVSSSMAAMQKLDLKKRQLRDYLLQNNVTGCTVIFNRRLRELCGIMPETAIMHDWWLALIASAFGRVCCMKGGDILYRQHGGNTEGAKNFSSILYSVRRLLDGGEIRISLEQTYRQAESFLEIYGQQLDVSQTELVRAYLSMERSGKCRKYAIMKKYGFMKSGLARKAGYIMFV